ncbi:complex I subunit 1 family protein [Cellulosimicrobium arenosum]|uniref:NADH-quinone oxidoreductase subunit H n=1 Tax=Cellulosimicrobium arenosum TaxID=2708133 RepID=A0A927J1W6_9MICO|nr:NADH-quinone oxidoreductase subunit H [Cellulosimicrobium arenosum]MBD8080377.1 NADH-quinone oxidoreductase subunit H [Cellulosimicrobium arenosum]
MADPTTWTSVWAGLGVVAGALVLGLVLAWFDAVARAGVRVGSRAVLVPAAAAPVREGMRLLLGQRRTTVAPDRLLRTLAVCAVPVLALTSAAVLPLGGHSVVSTSADLVWFNAAEALLWVAVWMLGWAPNAVHSLVGAYRFLAQGLAYELPLMFAIITVGVGAGSLRATDVVAAQAGGAWFVWTMPVALLVFLLGAAAFTFWGPFGAPAARDIAEGVLSELAGLDRLLVELGRAVFLGVASATAAAWFLGAEDGPVLPGAWWYAIKTLAVMAFLVGVGRRLPLVRPERFADIAWMVLLPLTILQTAVVAVLVLGGFYG